MHKMAIPVVVALMAMLPIFCALAHGDEGLELRTAARDGDFKKVQELLNKGADVDAKDENGVTALLEAYGGGHIEIMKLLLENEADIESQDLRKGVTILMAASTMGQAEVVKLLLEWEADVDAKANRGETALVLASFAGWPQVVKLLLEADADVNIKTHKGTTPLMGASVKADLRTLAASVTDKSTMGQLMTSRADHVEVVKLLLNAEADINAQDNDGATALMLAASAGHIDIVKLLLEAKADVKPKNKRGSTALQVALQKGHNNIVGLLKMHGADE